MMNKRNILNILWKKVRTFASNECCIGVGVGKKVIVRVEGLRYVDFNFLIAPVSQGLFKVNDNTLMRACIVPILKSTFFLSKRELIGTN